MKLEWTLRTREGSGVMSAAVSASFILQIPVEAVVMDGSPSVRDHAVGRVVHLGQVSDEAPSVRDHVEGVLVAPPPPPSPPAPPTALNGRQAGRKGKPLVGDHAFDQPQIWVGRSSS